MTNSPHQHRKPLGQYDPREGLRPHLGGSNPRNTKPPTRDQEFNRRSTHRHTARMPLPVGNHRCAFVLHHLKDEGGGQWHTANPMRSESPHASRKLSQTQQPFKKLNHPKLIANTEPIAHSKNQSKIQINLKDRNPDHSPLINLIN